MEISSHKNDALAKKKLSFLDLPAEVRNIIYELNLKAERPIQIRPAGKYRPTRGNLIMERSSKFCGVRGNGVEEDPEVTENGIRALQFKLLGLMLVNKQLSAEAISMFYGTNTFIIGPPSFSRHFDLHGRKLPSALQSLSLVVDKKHFPTRYPINSIQIGLLLSRMSREAFVEGGVPNISTDSDWPHLRPTSTRACPLLEDAAEFQEITRLVTARFPNLKYVDIRTSDWDIHGLQGFEHEYERIVEAFGVLLSKESVKEVRVSTMELHDDGRLWSSLLEAQGGECEKLKMQRNDPKSAW